MIQDDELKSAKALADAVSTQAQVANRSWLAMMTLALFAVLPRELSTAHTISLPFSLGSVPASSFYAVVYPLMIILVIAFSSAHAQQITAQNHAQNILNQLAHESGSQIKPRDWFDMWRKPSLNRVAPLPMSLYQIFPERIGFKLRRVVVRSYYAVLKFVALGIYFIFPLFALWYVYLARLGPVTRKLFIVGALLATWTLIQVVILEIIYAQRAGKHI